MSLYIKILQRQEREIQVTIHALKAEKREVSKLMAEVFGGPNEEALESRYFALMARIKEAKEALEKKSEALEKALYGQACLGGVR